MMRLAFSLSSLLISIAANNLVNPFLLNSSMVTSMPRSACTDAIFFVLRNPFKYAVAGYGVFNCVKGGVSSKMGKLKMIYFKCKSKC